MAPLTATQLKIKDNLKSTSFPKKHQKKKSSVDLGERGYKGI